MSAVTIDPDDGGADYASISAWITGESGDQGGAVASGTCSYSSTRQDTTAANISGFSNFSQLLLTVASGSRHTGVRDTGYEIVVNTSYSNTLTISDASTEVQYLECTNDNASFARAMYVNATNATVEYCIFEGGGTYGSLGLNGAAGTIRGNLCVNNPGGPGLRISAYCDANISNNTIANNSVGLRYGATGSDPIFVNNVIVGNTTNFQDDGGGLGSGSANYTAGESGDSIPGSNTITASTSDYANSAGGDYGVNDTGSAFYQAGTTVSGFTYDFEGDAWNTTVGFDEYIAAGGSGNPWYYYAQQ